MVGLTVSLPILALLAVLAALAVPAVTADPMDAVNAPVDPNDPFNPDLPVRGVITDAVFNVLENLGRAFVIPEPIKDNVKVVSFDVGCKTNADGQRQCNGMVCLGDTGRSSLPISLGRPDEGLYGVGVDPAPDSDGWYGPYQGVYVSKGGNCGCIGGVELKWVVE